MLIIIIALASWLFCELFVIPPFSSPLKMDLEKSTLESKNNALRRSIQIHESTIKHLEDSIEKCDMVIKAYKDHVPTVKESLSVLQHRKNQAVIDNDFAGYVSQDSIYMDTVSGLISLYESIIEIHESKAAAQDSIINTYNAKDSLQSQLYENGIALIRNNHKVEMEKLAHKLKRVKRQRNLSLGLNAILTAVIFWKK
nr:hypothetical protein [uncultured Fluviicola sp.]